MACSDLLSLSEMLNTLPRLRIPTAKEAMREETLMLPSWRYTPPRETFFFKQNQPLHHSCCCGFCDASEPQDLVEMRLLWILEMTDNQKEVADLFECIVSSLKLTELQRMASFFTSDSDYFMEIATNEYGSKRLQKLVGTLDEVDSLICAAILHRFPQVMTNEHASNLAVRDMRVWDGENKHAIFGYMLDYAVYLACDLHGYVVLNKIITEVEDSYYRDQLVDIIADNALWLSTDPIGNLVVQHLATMYDWFCAHCIAIQNISLRLRGHFVELSFDRHGSEVVKQLLEGKESVALVVLDLKECEEDVLMKLARSEFGNSVVCKALRVSA